MVLVTFDNLEPFIGQPSAIETWHFGSMKSSVLEIKSKKLIYTFVALVAHHIAIVFITKCRHVGQSIAVFCFQTRV